MTDNIRKLPLTVVGPAHVFPANEILEAAMDRLTEVVVIGRETDGTLAVFCSHGGAEALWLIEKGKLDLLGSSPNRAGPSAQGA